MSAPNPAEVIAEALAKHRDTGEHSCDYHCAGCGATGPFREFAAHQAAVIAALPDIAITIVPKSVCPCGTCRAIATDRARRAGEEQGR